MPLNTLLDPLRIDELPPVGTLTPDHKVPAFRDGATGYYSVAQVRDLVLAVILGDADAAFDTLGEIQAALGDDADLAATLTAAIAAKMDKDQNLADLVDAAAARANLGVSYVDAAAKAAFRSNLGLSYADDADKAAFRANIGVGGWELIADIEASAAALSSLTDLSAYRLIRIFGDVSVSADGANFGVQLSSDNGSNWIASGSTYYRLSHYSNSAAPAPAGDYSSGATFGQINLADIGNASNEGLTFEMTIGNFNKAAHKTGIADSANVNSIGAFYAAQQKLRWQIASACDALRLFPTSGTYSGRIVVEGWQG